MEAVEDPKRSTRDREEMRARLERWLARKLPPDAAPEISEIAAPSGTGMSSETLLFEAHWSEAGTRQTASLVARVAPDEKDVPVFPSYDLESQFRLLQLVARHGTTPVPGVRWLETDTGVLGAPFFVMDRVAGRVPPDIPPYVFAGWVLEGSAEERRTLQDTTVDAVASLHAIDPTAADTSFLELPVAGDTPLRRHFEGQRRYYAWVTGDGIRHPVLEEAFRWLEAHWPTEEGPTVISWGDSRIGNVLYDGWRPVALLDWEMAALGPRELDLGWMSFMHTFFQDIAEAAELPGLPDFLRPEEVAARYEATSGHTPRELPFYLAYAALRHGIVMARVHRRMVHFGQATWSEEPDACIPHRGTLQRMMDAR